MSATRFTDEQRHRAILGPVMMGFLEAIYGYADGTYPDALLCAAADVLHLPPGRRTLPLAEETAEELSLILGKRFRGTYEGAAREIQAWGVGFKSDRSRLNRGHL